MSVIHHKCFYFLRPLLSEIKDLTQSNAFINVFIIVLEEVMNLRFATLNT